MKLKANFGGWCLIIGLVGLAGIGMLSLFHKPTTPPPTMRMYYCKECAQLYIKYSWEKDTLCPKRIVWRGKEYHSR